MASIEDRIRTHRQQVGAQDDPMNPLGLPSEEELNMPVPERPAPQGPMDALPPRPVHGIVSGPPGMRTPADPRAAPPAPAPESGTLPGEEQVTTMDVFKRLSADEQAAVRRNYEGGSRVHTESFEDYISGKYGDMPPDVREMAMRAEYGSPNELSPAARARVAAGKPLPEGYKLGHYTPDQRRTMSRNVHSPEVPMTPFGGTFTLNADGSRSSRAPNASALADAQKAAEYYGDGSFEHMVAMGRSYGIDTSQYRPEDVNLLRADVAREQERHDRLGKKYDVVKTPMGGTRYKANPQKLQAAVLDNEAQMSPQRKMEFARTIANRYGRMMSPEEKEAMLSLVHTPDGFTKLREINEQMRFRLGDLQHQTWRDRQANFSLTRDLRNPNYAPGMYVRSLMDAVRAGDPVALSVAQDIAGNQRGAQRAMDMAMQERAVAGNVAQAQIANRPGQAQPSRTLADQMSPEYMAAVRMSPGLRETALGVLFRKSGVPEEQIPAAVQSAVMAHEASSNPQGEFVQSHLKSLANNKPAFIAFVTQQMNLPKEQAEQMWLQATGRTPQAAAQRGADAAAGIGRGVQNQVNWWGGFTGLSGTSPQAWGGG
jgi:hypothetical protein